MSLVAIWYDNLIWKFSFFFWFFLEFYWPLVYSYRLVSLYTLIFERKMSFRESHLFYKKVHKRMLSSRKWSKILYFFLLFSVYYTGYRIQSIVLFNFESMITAAVKSWKKWLREGDWLGGDIKFPPTKISANTDSRQAYSREIWGSFPGGNFLGGNLNSWEFELVENLRHTS